jgi:hypothetical protein
MTLLEVINAVLALALEVCMLWAYGAWGFHVGDGTWMRWLLMLGVVVFVIAVWAVWAAPKSAKRLPPPGLYVFKACVFAGAGLALFAMGHPIQAGVFLALSTVHLAVSSSTQRLNPFNPKT